MSTGLTLAVAPRVGAWIETLLDKYPSLQSLSHPVWVRGLKLHWIIIPLLLQWVAPRVGAWIETSILGHHKTYHNLSHPVWVRGLKLNTFGIVPTKNYVAPRVGAWIETSCDKSH